ncbi:unnamed protein product [Arctia plantaginis]|uniref:Uncharacterized protein n=1 Tax=Arctia plantaginis TaxID=874455 RepID=A0A8S0ZX79_ARCPL|nr:unnamed protein product [Arctia plantaginis]
MDGTLNPSYLNLQSDKQITDILQIHPMSHFCIQLSICVIIIVTFITFLILAASNMIPNFTGSVTSTWGTGKGIRYLETFMNMSKSCAHL